VPTWHIDCHMVPNSPRGNNYKTGGAIIRRGRPGGTRGIRRASGAGDKNRDMNVPPLRIW